MIVNRLIGTLRTHSLALVLAAMLTALVALPYVLIPYALGGAYQGIAIQHIAGGNDQFGYLIRGKEALEGSRLGQIYLSDGKANPDPTFSHVERIILSPLRALGANPDIAKTYAILDTIGVFALILLLYALIFRLSGDRLLAIAAAIFVVGGSSIVENKEFFYTSFNVYGRFPIPFASSAAFFGFLYASYRAVIEKQGWLWVFAAAALFGLLFYIYFYAWTFALAYLGALFLVMLVWRDLSAVRIILGIGIIGLCIGSVNLVPFLGLYLSGAGEQLSFFLWSMHGRDFVMSFIGLAFAMLYSVYVWRVRGDRNSPFILACILAGWVALDQQLITGRYLQYGHYYWYFIVPLAILLGAYMTSRILPTKLATAFAVLLISLAFLNTAVGQYRSTYTGLAESAEEQLYVPLLSALKRHPKASVLAGHGGGSYALLVPIYTDHDLYWYFGATTYHLSIDRMKEAFFVYVYLNKDARDDMVAYFEKAMREEPTGDTIFYAELEAYYSGFDYYDYRKKLNANDPLILAARPGLLERLEGEYRASLPNDAALQDVLAARGVRYVLWDESAYPLWDLSPLELSLLKTSGDISLFEVRN